MLELIKPVTPEIDVNNKNKSKEENNIKVADDKSNNNTEKTVENVDTNDTFLELSESTANPKNAKKTMALTQVSVEKKKITLKKEERNMLENTESEDENKEVNKIENDSIMKKRSSRLKKPRTSG